MTQPEAPYTPDEWARVVDNAVTATGHGAEVVTAVETTPAGWKVTVNPVTAPTPPDGPVT